MIISTNEIPMLSGAALIGALKLSDSKSRNTKTILVTSNKTIAATQHRSTDPDYTVIKDVNFAENLAAATRRALAINEHP